MFSRAGVHAADVWPMVQEALDSLEFISGPPDRCARAWPVWLGVVWPASCGRLIKPPVLPSMRSCMHATEPGADTGAQSWTLRSARLLALPRQRSSCRLRARPPHCRYPTACAAYPTPKTCLPAPACSKWGSVRASMGRSEPWSINYMAIGNEARQAG